MVRYFTRNDRYVGISGLAMNPMKRLGRNRGRIAKIAVASAYSVLFPRDSAKEAGVIGIETFAAARNGETKAFVTARLHSCGISDKLDRGWIP